MAVSLTVSETMAGAAFSDSLAGGDSGIDFGQVTNGAFSNLIAPQSNNDGFQEVWIRHDASVDPIENLSTYIAEFSGTYGGAQTAATDFTDIKDRGFASSGSVPTNLDGDSSGLHVEMDWDVSTATQFDPSRIFTGGAAGAFVGVYGDGVASSTDGIDLSSALTIRAAAMVYNNTGTPTIPTGPADGKVAVIAKTGDSPNNADELGDNVRLRNRMYLKTAETKGGIVQWDLVYSYSYTA